jgi:hypothetical protein
MAFAQGRINFNNQATFSAADAITVGAQNQGVSGGLAGYGIGGNNYSVQLLWVAGVVGSQAAFDAAIPTASAVFTGSVFLANTGPLATFSGFFDAGAVAQGAPAGTYTFQVLAWYNQGYANYAVAQAAGANVGKSQLFQGGSTASPTPPNSTIFPGFTVSSTVVPEPGTLALAGLGAASLLLFRRKK